MGLYLVDYTIVRSAHSPQRVRGRLLALSPSDPASTEAAVAGDGELLHVHVRTTRPDEALRIGLLAGPVVDIRIRDVDAPARHVAAVA